MQDFDTRRDALFTAIAEEQQLPAEAIARSLNRHARSVLEFFVAHHDDRGKQGFDEAFRLVDLLENLGCTDVAMPTAELVDPVVVAGTLPQSGPFQITVPRGALNFDRPALIELLKQRLGVDRATTTTVFVRASSHGKPAEQPHVDAGPVSPRDIGLAGKLHQMPLEDLVQIFQMQRKTGRLYLHDLDDRTVEHGRVGFRDGTVVNAAAGGTADDAAFYALAVLPDGIFRFVEEDPGDATITTSTPSLLMEALRLKDEAGR